MYPTILTVSLSRSVCRPGSRAGRHLIYIKMLVHLAIYSNKHTTLDVVSRLMQCHA